MRGLQATLELSMTVAALRKEPHAGLATARGFGEELSRNRPWKTRREMPCRRLRFARQQFGPPHATWVLVTDVL